MIESRISALGRALRSFLQGVGSAVALAAWTALYTAVNGGEYNVRVLWIAVVTAAVGAAVTYVFNLVAPLAGFEGTPSVEGIVRAVRTLVQFAASVGAIAAWEALYATWTSGVHNPRDLVTAAVTAGLAAVLAYFQNLRTAKAGRA